MWASWDCFICLTGNFWLSFVSRAELASVSSLLLRPCYGIGPGHAIRDFGKLGDGLFRQILYSCIGTDATPGFPEYGGAIGTDCRYRRGGRTCLSRCWCGLDDYCCWGRRLRGFMLDIAPE